MDREPNGRRFVAEGEVLNAQARTQSHSVDWLCERLVLFSNRRASNELESTGPTLSQCAQVNAQQPAHQLGDLDLAVSAQQAFGPLRSFPWVVLDELNVQHAVPV